MKHKNIAIFVPHAGCPYRCSFCDQRTITAQDRQPRGEDVRRICTQAFREIKELRETEIAFFGGSFTAIPRDEMCALLAAAQPFAEQCKGIRISTRPDCIDREILEILKAHRVTAIELGAQSMNDRVLAENGRSHTAGDVRKASQRIREGGFELGLQIMPGLYGSTPQDDWETLEAVCAIHPNTVRIYPVVILKGTRLGTLYETGQYRPIPFAQMTAQVARFMCVLMDNGIRIIKVGLHASEFVAQDALGGYYHPAFRELCESEIFKSRMETVLLPLARNGRQIWTLAVHPTCVSKAIGQKKANICHFHDTYGMTVTIIGDESVPPYEIQIKEQACI